MRDTRSKNGVGSHLILSQFHVTTKSTHSQSINHNNVFCFPTSLSVANKGNKDVSISHKEDENKKQNIAFFLSLSFSSSITIFNHHLL